MRYRLVVLIFSTMSLLLLSSVASAGDGDKDGSDRRLLPVSGQSVELSAIRDQNGSGEQTQHISNIEAIPTPTAFHTGTVLLLVIVGGRLFRRMRLFRQS